MLLVHNIHIDNASAIVLQLREALERGHFNAAWYRTLKSRIICFGC